jgi:excisionase family DNA binding protein
MFQTSRQPGALALTVPPELVDEIARRAADLLAEQYGRVPDYLTATETASYMRCGSKQRVYDLVSQGRIEPCRDGTRLLFKRSTVDAYLAGEESA